MFDVELLLEADFQLDQCLNIITGYYCHNNTVQYCCCYEVKKLFSVSVSYLIRKSEEAKGSEKLFKSKLDMWKLIQNVKVDNRKA